MSSQHTDNENRRKLKIPALPFRVATKLCVNGEWWYAKAALSLRCVGQALPVFGFSCSESKEQAIKSAKFECVEHLWGRMEFYTSGSLAEHLPVQSWPSGSCVGKIARSKLLIGSSAPQTAALNATGLALGSPEHDAISHSVMELFERHYAASWWNKETLTLRRKYADIDANRIRAVLVRQVERGYFAVSLEVDQSLPLTCFGSAFRSDYLSAVRHAEEEYIMLKTDMSDSTKISNRHRCLVDESYCRSIYEKLLTKFSFDHEFNETPIPNCYYSYLYSEEDIILVRAFSDNALDVTRNLSEIRSPFL
ncbi:hypothetical protein J2782_003195 [Brucella pseudogrignonensis]|uniref:YcaO domain-containing protein n=2 Tax=Brucella pseudogrignonensis TaxID=419475 RepID=A0ABU1MBN2_9HYPH|nr:hypothetical protein [Brucella pseudogrignonensis]